MNNFFDTLSGPIPGATKVKGVGTVPLVKTPSIMQSPFEPFNGNFFDAVQPPKNQVQFSSATPKQVNTPVNMVSQQPVNNRPTLEDILGNYFQNADIGTAKKSTKAYQKAYSDFTTKVFGIAEELRATYDIPGAVQDKQIVEEFLRQNNSQEILDSLFTGVRQTGETLKKQSAFQAIANDIPGANTGVGRQVRMLSDAQGMLESGTYGLASKGIQSVAPTFAKNNNIKSSTNIVEDLVNIAGAGSRLGSVAFMPGATAGFGIASELPGSRDLIDATLGKAMNYISETKGFGLLAPVYDKLDDNLKNELSGVIMNGLFTTLGMKVRNSKGQLSARTIAENFTNPKNLMANIDEIIFNKAKQGEIQGTLLQEIMNTPSNMFGAVKRLFPEKMPKQQVLDQNKNTIPGALPKKQNEVGFTDRMLGSIYGLDAENIALMRNQGELFDQAQQGNITNETLGADIEGYMNMIKYKKGPVGATYEKLYDSEALLPGRQIRQNMMDKLTSLGIKIDEKGDITYDTKKIVLNPKEIPIIKNILKIADDIDTDVITPKEAHTVRQNIYEIRQYEDGLAKVPSRTAEAVIDVLDSELKKIPGRKETDALFSTITNQAKEIQDEFFTKKEDLKINPTALLGDKHTKKLAFLEERMPGFTDKLKAIKAVKDYENTRNRHKVGLYEKAGNVATNGGIIAGGTLFGGLPGFLASSAVVLAKYRATDPKRLTQMIVKKGGEQLLDKIVTKDKLSFQEKAKLQEIVDMIDAENEKIRNSRPRLPEPKATEVTPEGEVKQTGMPAEKKTFKKEITELDKRPDSAKRDPYEAERAKDEQKKQFKKQAEIDKETKAKELLAQLTDKEQYAKRDYAGYGKDVNAPQVGDMTKYGKVTEVKGMGGMANQFRVKIEGSNEWRDPFSIDGVYRALDNNEKPVVSESLDDLINKKQEFVPDPLANIAKNGRRNEYLKTFSEELGIDIEQITDPVDRQKMADMVNARNSDKQWDLAKELWEKYGDPTIDMFARTKRKGEILSTGEAVDYIKKYFSPDEVTAKFVKEIVTPDGMKAIGSYSEGLIRFVENPTKTLLDHESLHAYIDKFVNVLEREDLYKEAYGKHGDEIRAIQKKYGIDIREASEEWIADGFVAHVKKTRSFTGKIKAFFDNIREQIKGIFGNKSKINQLYNDILNKVRPEEKINIKGEVRWKAFGETDRYTMQPILDIRKEVKGDFVKKATLQQMVNRQGYKLPEKMALQKVIDNMEGDGMIKELAVDQLKQEIIPLSKSKTENYADYNKLYKPENAETIIYNTPFELSNDNHFRDPNYFAHVRIEGKGKNKTLMELQSDYMQHKDKIAFTEERVIKYAKRELNYLLPEGSIDKDGNKGIKKTWDDIQNIKTRQDVEKIMNKAIEYTKKYQPDIFSYRRYKEYIGETKQVIKDLKGIQELNKAYKNEGWVRRTLDETVKNLAQDGAETLKIPYGPTIAQIEGHSIQNKTSVILKDGYTKLKKHLLKNESFMDQNISMIMDMEAQDGNEITYAKAKKMFVSDLDERMAMMGIKYREDGNGADITDPAIFEDIMRDHGLNPDEYITIDLYKNVTSDDGVINNKSIIDNMPHKEQQTVARFYEDQLVPYAKKAYPGGKDVEYQGAWWYEIPIAEYGNKPLKVYKRAETYTQKELKIGDKLYHTTNEDFNTFDPEIAYRRSMGEDDYGTWFSTKDENKGEFKKTIITTVKKEVKLMKEEAISQFFDSDEYDYDKAFHKNVIDAGYEGIDYGGGIYLLYDPEGVTEKVKPLKVYKRDDNITFLQKAKEHLEELYDEDNSPENVEFSAELQKLAENGGYTLDTDMNNEILIGVNPKIPIMNAQKKFIEMNKFFEVDNNLIANPDGTLKMFHGTNKKDAQSIVKNGFDGSYFSSSMEESIGGVNGASYYGDTILEADIDPRYLEFNPAGEYSITSSKGIKSIKIREAENKKKSFRK